MRLSVALEVGRLVVVVEVPVEMKVVEAVAWARLRGPWTLG